MSKSVQFIKGNGFTIPVLRLSKTVLNQYDMIVSNNELETENEVFVKCDLKGNIVKRFSDNSIKIYSINSKLYINGNNT